MLTKLLVILTPPSHFTGYQNVFVVMVVVLTRFTLSKPGSLLAGFTRLNTLVYINCHVPVLLVLFVALEFHHHPSTDHDCLMAEGQYS